VNIPAVTPKIQKTVAVKKKRIIFAPMKESAKIPPSSFPIVEFNNKIEVTS
jgi:hypothetical protein